MFGRTHKHMFIVWSKRALIARGSQRVFLEGDCCVLSLAIVAVDTDEYGLSKVRQVTNKANYI